MIMQLTRREVVGRYRGSVIGLAWSFFNPILMLSVYTFVFGVVFKARWGLPGQENRAQFALILFVGLIVYGMFADCINRAPGLIKSNANFVTKVVFPLEVLPVVSLCSAFFHFAVSLLVLLLAAVVVNGLIPWTALWLPLIILPLMLGTLGLSWALASLGLYLQDTTQTVAILTTVLMYLSPVFFPLSALPEPYRGFVELNPLSFYMEQARGVLILGRMPDWPQYGVHLVLAVLVAWGGFWWFQKTRKGFADVL